MTRPTRLSRRELLLTTLATAPWIAAPLIAGPLIGAPRLLLGAGCTLTPEQTEGPFYMGGATGIPRALTPNDLTRVAGAGGSPEGEVIRVAGRVTDRECRAVAGARVEIWQACATGRYGHPRDRNPARLDPNFAYFGYAVTDASGHYAFTTVKPAPYPVGGGWVRPAHIHFRVDAAQMPRLTTQMYFAGDPYLGRDGILNAVPPALRPGVIIEPARSPDRPQGPENFFRFDLALAGNSPTTRA